MYSFNYLTSISQIAEFLGVGRNTAQELCKLRPYGMPVVKVGRQYRADQDKLADWRDRWYAGEFDIY